MRRLVVPLSLLIAGGCSSTPTTPDGDGPAPPDNGTQVERPCTTTFRYEVPDGATTPGTVEVAGAWDRNVRTGLSDEDGDGVWIAAIRLEPGNWAYRLVVDGTPILDPGRPYRMFDGGVESSAVNVESCAKPQLELLSFVQSGTRVTVRIRVWRGNGGPNLAPGQVSAIRRFEFAETAAALMLDGNSATVALDDLPAGKHTLVLNAVDDAGQAAMPLVLPFWVEAKPFDWRGPLYMITLDRFRNGDLSNDPDPTAGAADAADFAGGDLRGIVDAIDEGVLDELGVTTIWVSPWVMNAGGLEQDGGRGVTSFRGDWPVRGRQIDPRFGTAQDLEAMVTAAHRHGIRVLMDFAINHVHEDHEYFTAHPTWFRTACQCGTAGCDWTERRLDCSLRAYLPDVNWESPEAAAQLIADALWWLERYDLDGLRVGAVKHVEDLAVINLSASIHDHLEGAGTEYFLLGETAMGWRGDSVHDNRVEYATIARYIGEDALSGQLDFVLYHGAAYRVWASEERGVLHADYWTKVSLEQYPSEAIMTPFVGNSDSPRFVSLAEAHGQGDLPNHRWSDQGLPGAPMSNAPYQRAALAHVWLLGLPGAPLLYYGDEYGEFGGADPDNRHMWRSPEMRSGPEQSLYAGISRMGRARRDLPALREGGYRTIVAEESFLAFARETQAEFAVVALNRSGTGATRSIAIPGNVSRVVDLLAPGALPIPVSGGNAQVTVPPMSAVVLVPAP